MGKRKRKPVDDGALTVLPSDKPSTTRVWTHEDRCNLLKGLRTYGHTDIDGISGLLPNKTKPSIRLMIQRIMQKARTLTRRKSPALNAWLESGKFDDQSRPIPQALRYISMFERHPTPEESGGFDFRAAYDYLHRMTFGLPAIDLPPGTLNTINTLMAEVQKEIWPTANDDVVTYLGTLGQQKEPDPKCYPPMNRLNGIKNDFWFDADEEIAE